MSQSIRSEEEIASDPTTPQETLILMFNTTIEKRNRVPMGKILTAIASNPNTPAPVLRALFGLPGSYRDLVLANPALGLITLEDPTFVRRVEQWKQAVALRQQIRDDPAKVLEAFRRVGSE